MFKTRRKLKQEIAELQNKVVVYEKLILKQAEVIDAIRNVYQQYAESDSKENTNGD